MGLDIDATHTHCHWSPGSLFGEGQQLGLQFIQLLPDILLQFLSSPGSHMFQQHGEGHQHLLNVTFITGLT